jgi:hypothetical protein
MSGRSLKEFTWPFFPAEEKGMLIFTQILKHE